MWFSVFISKLIQHYILFKNTKNNTFPSSLSFITFARDSICSMVDCVLDSVFRDGEGPMSSSSSLTDGTGLTTLSDGKTGPINDASFTAGSQLELLVNPAGNAGPNIRSGNLAGSLSKDLPLSASGRSEPRLDFEELEESDEDDRWWRFLVPLTGTGGGSGDWETDELFLKPGGNTGP